MNKLLGTLPEFGMCTCRQRAPKFNLNYIMEVCLWYKEVVFYNKKTGEGFQSRSAAPAAHLPANPGEREA